MGRNGGLLALFDPRSIERGTRYFEEGRVENLRLDGSVAVSLVRGSAPTPYTVFVDTADPVSSRCSCPVGRGCKHLVATILALPSEDTERVVDVEAALQGVEVLEPAGSNNRRRRPVKGRGRWRAVFLVYLSPELRPMVLLGRQYLRRDGTPGRVERFRWTEILQEAGSPVDEMVERLRVFGGEAPLLAFGTELAKAGAPVFLSDEQLTEGLGSSPVTLIEAPVIGLEVVPKSQVGSGDSGDRSSRKPKLEFELTVRVDSDGTSHAIPAEAFAASDQGMGRTVLLFGTGVVLLGEERGPLTAIIPYLTGPDPLGMKELGLLRRLSSGSQDSISLKYPRSVRVLPSRDGLLFLLSAWGRQASASLETDSRSAADGYDGEEYRLHTTTAAEEQRAVRSATEILASPPYYAPETRTWHWWMTLGREITDVLQAGIALAEEGFPVFLEDSDGIRLRVRRLGPLSVHVSSGTDWFAPTVKLADGTTLDFESLEAVGRDDALRQGNTILYLDPRDVTRLKRLREVAAGCETGTFFRNDLSSLVDVAALADEIAPDLEGIRSLAEALLRPAEAVPSPGALPQPAGLQATLRPYQADGYRWLALLARHGLSGCLADDMGLGKTVQALALMLHLRQSAHRIGLPQPPGDSSSLLPGGFLVVAPVSTIENWRREAARFAPDLRTAVHHGPKRPRNAESLTGADLTITSYATVARDRELFLRVQWRLVVLDEAQFIKNPYARTTVRIKELSADLKLCLTGTPVENVSTDLFSIMDFLHPGLLGSLRDFSNRYPKRNINLTDESARRLRRLSRKVAPFLLRRTKEAVAPELPPRIETVLSCEMGPKQARFYEALRVVHRDRVRAAIASRKYADIGAAIFTGLLRLRQAALYPEDADPVGRGVPSVKEAELLSQLAEVVAGGHRALVFSQFVSGLKRLCSAAEEKQIDTLYLDGQTTAREGLIDRFQHSDSPVVFFVSLRAGGTGINLTAADYVYICDPWWNPQVERQAVDRAHRIGRNKPVMVTRLVTAGTVEQKVLELQEQKRRLASDLIEENGAGLAGYSPEELLALFD